MATPVDAKRRAMSTYNAAADFYDHPVNTFWEWYGQQTVSRLRLEAGAKILDVCCGSGASAIPAAETVGPNGFVLGVDLAENLIELAKTKARERGLENTEFRFADMLDLDLAPSTFDAAYFLCRTCSKPSRRSGSSCDLAAGSLSPPGDRGSSSL